MLQIGAKYTLLNTSSEQETNAIYDKTLLLHDSFRSQLKYKNAYMFARVMESLTFAGALQPGEQILIAAPNFNGNTQRSTPLISSQNVKDIFCDMALLTLTRAATKEYPHYEFDVQSYANGDLTIGIIARLSFKFTIYDKQHDGAPRKKKIAIPALWSVKSMHETKAMQDYLQPTAAAIRRAMFAGIPMSLDFYSQMANYFVFRYIPITVPVPCYDSQLAFVVTQPNTQPQCFNPRD